MTIIEPANRRFTSSPSLPAAETLPDLSVRAVKDLNELILAYPNETGNIAVLAESPCAAASIRERLILSGIPPERIIITDEFDPRGDWLGVVADTKHINALKGAKRDHDRDVLCIYVASDKSDKVNDNTAHLAVFPNMTAEKIADALYAPLFEVLEVRNPTTVSAPPEANETQTVVDKAKSHLASGKILLHSHIWNEYSLSDHFKGIINMYESDNFSEKTEWARTPEEALEKLRQNPAGYYTAVFSENADFLGSLEKSNPELCRLFISMNRYYEGDYLLDGQRAKAHAILNAHHAPVKSLATIIDKAFCLLKIGQDISMPEADETLLPKSYGIM